MMLWIRYPTVNWLLNLLTKHLQDVLLSLLKFRAHFVYLNHLVDVIGYQILLKVIQTSSVLPGFITHHTSFISISIIQVIMVGFVNLIFNDIFLNLLYVFVTFEGNNFWVTNALGLMVLQLIRSVEFHFTNITLE